MIADTSQNKCVHRGISVMRLALGYPTGLPAGFPKNGPMEFTSIIRWFARSFPDRDTFAWHPEWWRVKHPANMVYFGGLPAEKVDDRFLTAFAIPCPGNETDAHFLVGEPIKDMRIEYVLRVTI